MPSVEPFVSSMLQGFVNSDNTEKKTESYLSLASGLIAFVIVLVILALIGKFLWNGVIVELFSFAKPARSYLQILGLYVFTSLLL